MDCLTRFFCCGSSYQTDADIRMEPTEDTRLVEYPPVGGMKSVTIKVANGRPLDDVGLNNEAYISYHSSRGWLLVQPVSKNLPDVHSLTCEKSQSGENGQKYSITFNVQSGGNSVDIPVTVTIPNGIHDRAMMPLH